MGWRTIVISKRAKLDLQLNFLVIRQEQISKVHLTEIAIIIIESTAVSITAALLSELTKRKIKVIFCDEKRNPSSELVSYYGSHDTSNKVRNQISWSSNNKSLVWTQVVREKIRKQRDFLLELEKEDESDLLSQYVNEIEIGDVTNREGHAAKVYFNAVFGLDFTRSDDNNINAALNYGYSILLSAFNREIIINGYITQIGIFHDNMFNKFNLGSDLMEPFRPLIDKAVYSMKFNEFGHSEKMYLVNVLNQEVFIDKKQVHLLGAIKIYVRSVFDALNEGDISVIRFYNDEL